MNDPSKYPVAVTFHFKDKKALQQFLGGLSDGWGENYCDMDWAWKKKRKGQKRKHLGDASDIFILSSFPDGEPDEG